MSILSNLPLTGTHAAIEELAPFLVTIGLLSEDDYGSAQAHLSRAKLASRTARDYEQRIKVHAERIGDKLSAGDELTEDDITDAAIDLPSEANVDRIATHVYTNAVKTARDIAFANRGKIAHILNEAFDHAVTDFKAVTAKLGNVRTAQQAVDANKTADWRKLTDIKNRYDELAAIRNLARKHCVIPIPEGSNSGAFWLYREDATDETRCFKADKTEFGVLAAELLRRPWTPPTKQDALAVAERWKQEYAARTAEDQGLAA